MSLTSPLGVAVPFGRSRMKVESLETRTMLAADSLGDDSRPGDANHDGRFSDVDILQVYEMDRYMRATAATWEQGDWNGDGLFDQHDIVRALQVGGFERDPCILESSSSEPVAGDANRDGVFDQYDLVQVLQADTFNQGMDVGWDQGDWNGDGAFDRHDLDLALGTDCFLRQPYLTGDANRDGKFDEKDLAQILDAGEYLTHQDGAQWSQGDWNADGRFDQHDVILALQTGRSLE